MRRAIVAAAVFVAQFQQAKAADCTFAISNNCNCLEASLRDKLGEDRTKLLFKIWLQALSRHESERHRFFHWRAKEIQATVLAFGQHKSAIAVQCGTLNLPSDGMN
jgi:hypothetical protein